MWENVRVTKKKKKREFAKVEDSVSLPQGCRNYFVKVVETILQKFGKQFYFS